jgi:hypothetical protein
MSSHTRSLPPRPSSLSHEECIKLLERIQEICFLSVELVHDSSPVPAWTPDKVASQSAAIGRAVVGALREGGLSPHGG